MLCYDNELTGPPYCDTEKEQTGRYYHGSDEVLLRDTCSSEFIDYYDTISSMLQQKQSRCSYSDYAYDEVNFVDATSSKAEQSIEAMKHFCIVK